MIFSKPKLYIYMLIIGFICTIFHLNITTPLHYPEKYANTNQVIGEFQYYNIASHYNATCDYKMINGAGSNDDSPHYDSVGQNNQSQTTTTQNSTSQTAKVINNVYYKNLRIDLFNDFLGFLLIIIACFGLKKCGKLFSLGAFLGICSFVLHAVIVALPFFINGLLLCNFVFFIGIAYLICSVLTLYLIANGLFRMCLDVSCRDERKWCKILIFAILVAHLLISFIFWIGADFKALHNLGAFMEFVNLLLMVLFWKILFRAMNHIQLFYINKSE